MTETAGPSTDHLGLSFDCPNCGYLLRGLPGPVVTCPECGRSCDIPRMIARQRSNWATNSEYIRVARSAILAQMSLVLLAPPLVILSTILDAPILLAAAAPLLLVWWGYLVVKPAWGHRAAETVWLILLLHIVFLGYLLGAVVCFAAAASLIVSVLTGALEGFGELELFLATTSLLTLGAGVGSLFILFRLDRHVGRRCIRRYLLSVGAPEEA